MKSNLNKIFRAAIEKVRSLYSTDDDYNKAYAELESLSEERTEFNVNEIDFPGIYGNTKLMWCISYGKAVKPDGALILLKMFNANPFIPDNNGKNALHFLLLKGHDTQRCIVDEVLKHTDINKHINDKTVHGDTCLHIACVRRDESWIAFLLEKGADLNIKNKKGQTPIDLLYLAEKERLAFLSASEYLGFESDLEYVATINKEIFNSDPKIIEEKYDGKKVSQQLSPNSPSPLGSKLFSQEIRPIPPSSNNQPEQSYTSSFKRLH